MQVRFNILFVSIILPFLAIGCGKKGGSGGGETKPQEPSLTTPGVVVGEGSAAQPPGAAGNPTATPPAEPKPNGPPVGPDRPGSEVKPTPGADKFAKALTGLWGLAIAQKPRACSSIYDLRDVRSLHIHVLCPGDKGRTISLQTESFTRVSDDGQTALFRRVSSTCGVSPTTAGSVFMTYTLDADRKLVISEGTKASPALDPLAESNYAADLKSVSSVHGRSLVRGCFRSGNLQNFEATRTAR